jgi:hypothetical protein
VERRSVPPLRVVRRRHRVGRGQRDVGRGGRVLADSPSALELTAWSVSEDHLALRAPDHRGAAGTRP